MEKLVQFIAIYILTTCLVVQTKSPFRNGKEFDDKDPSDWNTLAQNQITKAIHFNQNINKAKNVIFFLGDGMGIATLTASRILKGQKQGKPGEEAYLNFETFHNTALIKTYNVDSQVPDSAGTATAFLTGVKGNIRLIGLDGGAKYGNCESISGHELSSILEWSQNAGKHTGFITTTRVTHATPAGLYANTVNRDWEASIPLNIAHREVCKDIALQLMEDIPGKNCKVIMGGGRLYFLPENVTDENSGKRGLRIDGRNLIKEWQTDKKDGIYMGDLEDFQKWNPEETKYALGLFGVDHLDYEVDRKNDSKGQPSIAQMTRKAIKMLQKGPNGFFLFIEGGKIDHAHHATNPYRALEEMLAMEKAIEVALDMTNSKDTLIIVTADHSHTMTISGYPARGNPIYGVAGTSEIDLEPYTTISYANGPGYNISDKGIRANVSGIDTGDKNYLSQTTVPLGSETHGGEDVALYAKGPWSHLFHGLQEQNYIAHAIAYASCVGNFPTACNN